MAEPSRMTMMLSVFLSYGGPDVAFAHKLAASLRQHQVEVFEFIHDATPGQRLARLMHEQIRVKERVVLICSRESLDRPGVLYEIVQAVNHEAEGGGTERIIPIALDDYLAKHWDPSTNALELAHLRPELLGRVIADFSGWQDEERYSTALARLLRALIPASRRWTIVRNAWPARIGEFAGNGSARAQLRSEGGLLLCRVSLRIGATRGFAGVFWEFPEPVDASSYERFRCKWRARVRPIGGTLHAKLETVRDWPQVHVEWPGEDWSDVELFTLSAHSEADWQRLVRITIAIDTSDVPAQKEYVLDVAELFFE